MGTKISNNKFMKKIIFLAILFSLIPFAVFATSGACSSHGGVDCSAGADSATGNAICNDGWVSSTSYYNTDECQASRSHCIIPTGGCDQTVLDLYQNDYNQCVQQETQIAQKLADSLAMSCARGGGTGCISNPTPDLSTCATFSSSAQLCKAKMDKYNTEVQTYKQCEANEEEIFNNQIQLQKDSIAKSLEILKQQNLDKTCGDPFATYNQKTNKCECDAGYTKIDPITGVNYNSCLSADEINQIDSVIPTTTPTSAKKSKFLEGATIGQSAKPQTKGIDFSKFTSDPKVAITTPSVTPANVTTTTVTPKESIMGKVWEFIKGLFGKK